MEEAIYSCVAYIEDNNLQIRGNPFTKTILVHLMGVFKDTDQSGIESTKAKRGLDLGGNIKFKESILFIFIFCI